MSTEPELVDRFKDSVQAVMLRDVLKGNGFHATIQGQGGMSGSGARMTGGYMVMVPGVEMHEVRKFLKRLEKEAFLNEEDEPAQPAPKTILAEDEHPEKCPHCGSTDIQEIKSPPALQAAMTILLLGLPLLFPKPRTWMCRKCEQHWP